MKRQFDSAFIHFVVVVVACLVTVIASGCGSGGGGEDEIASTSQAANPPFTITGTIVDATSKALPGVTLAISGGATATTTTGANGSFSFGGLGRASFTITPSKTGCTFQPTSISRTLQGNGSTANFAGFGMSCGGNAVNTGAIAGSLTIRGVVIDSALNPVPGARLVLSGGATATRTSTSTGAFSFSVNRGSYTLQTASGCTYTPSSAQLTNLTRSRTLLFIRNSCSAVCVPATTCPAGQNCGTAPDGCGGTISCGTCAAPNTCGGAGAAGHCGHPCDVSTAGCLQSRPAGCFECAMDSGCLDPEQLVGTCEQVSGSAPAACMSVEATSSTPTETRTCLHTLKTVFESGCAADGQLTTCLCGSTDPTQCQNGSATPDGPGYPVYACDFGSDISQITSSFTVPTYGAGMGNAIVQCLAAVGCSCF